MIARLILRWQLYRALATRKAARPAKQRSAQQGQSTKVRKLRASTDRLIASGLL